MADRHQDVGLFRYSLIRDPADPALSKAERGALVRALAEATHTGPDGKAMRVGRSTLDGWIRDWRAGGFEALVPRPRRMEPRTPAEVLGLAVALKREVPGRTAAQVRRIMDATGDNEVCSRRTIQRHFARLGLNTRPDGSPPRAYGRFQASAANELWTGDALHGPQVGGKKAYLLAFIDDYSRALVGYRWTHAEDTLRLEAALRSGLGARGVPGAILVDRGSAFVSSQLLRACAVLGIRLIHARPRAQPPRGKSRDFSGLSGPSSSSRWQPGGWAAWPSSTPCSRPGSRSSTTGAFTPRPTRRPWSASWPTARRSWPCPRTCTRPSCGPRRAW